ncbi:hypothetical protein ACQWKR_24190, partial [Salmonella enterica subsp. enterica serovar Infantis]
LRIDGLLLILLMYIIGWFVFRFQVGFHILVEVVFFYVGLVCLLLGFYLAPPAWTLIVTRRGKKKPGGGYNCPWTFTL